MEEGMDSVGRCSCHFGRSGWRDGKSGSCWAFLAGLQGTTTWRFKAQLCEGEESRRYSALAVYAALLMSVDVVDIGELHTHKFYR
jgi:hypothetical protein